MTEHANYCCPNAKDLRECYGYKGIEVLDSLSVTYPALSHEDTVTKDILTITLMALVFKLMFVSLASLKCKGAKQLEPECPGRIRNDGSALVQQLVQ